MDPFWDSVGFWWSKLVRFLGKYQEVHNLERSLSGERDQTECQSQLAFREPVGSVPVASLSFCMTFMFLQQNQNASVSCRDPSVPLLPTHSSSWSSDSLMCLSCFLFSSSDNLNIWFLSPFSLFLLICSLNVRFTQRSFHLYTALALFLFCLKRKKFLKFILIQLFTLLFFLIAKVYFSKNYDKSLWKEKFAYFSIYSWSMFYFLIT